MIEIKLLSESEIISHQEDLKFFMNMVLSENIDGNIDVEKLSAKYVEDMKAFIKDGSAVLIGAFDCERIVGFQWGYETSYFGERRMHSYFIVIHPEYRGQKIGSCFSRKLEEIALSKGIDTIEAMCTYKNQTAVNYHINNGFEIERMKVVKRLNAANNSR